MTTQYASAMHLHVSNSRTLPSSIAEVFRSIEDELRSESAWARPYLFLRNGAGGAPLAAGQAIWLELGPLRFPRMLMRVVEVSPPEKIVVEYVGGDFSGYGAFVLHSIDAGTKVTFSWNARPESRRMRLVARLLPVRHLHWTVVDRVLRNLERHARNMEAKTEVPYFKVGENLILFDGVCKLCNAWSNFIMRHDHRRRFKLASVQSPEGQAILAHFGYPTDHYDTMLVVQGGKCYAQSEAFFVVMRTLGMPWAGLLVFRFIPERIRNWLYDRIALNRYRLFGRYDYCALPSPDHNERFLRGS